MKKINKFLLSVALIFSLFMICGEVKAEEPYGDEGEIIYSEECTNDTCSSVIRSLSSEEKANISSIVDPELLTLDENSDIYYVGFMANDGNRTTRYFSIEIFSSDMEIFPSEKILGYVPLTDIGGKSQTHVNGSSYYIDHNLQATRDALEGETVITGVLIVDKSFDPNEYTTTFFQRGIFSEIYGSELTLNGIKNSYNGMGVSFDVFFGDFKFNFVQPHDFLDGYWEPVNSNSNKLIIDNTKVRSTDLNLELSWFPNNEVGLELANNPQELMQGDTAPTILGGKSASEKSDNYVVSAGKKINFSIQPYGGNMITAQEIISNGGTIGHLSLYVSTDF